MRLGKVCAAAIAAIALLCLAPSSFARGHGGHGGGFAGARGFSGGGFHGGAFRGGGGFHRGYAAHHSGHGWNGHGWYSHGWHGGHGWHNHGWYGNGWYGGVTFAVGWPYWGWGYPYYWYPPPYAYVPSGYYGYGGNEPIYESRPHYTPRHQEPAAPDYGK